jgi:outer membrane protein
MSVIPMARLLNTAVCLLAVLAAASTIATAQDVKVGTIDFARIEREAPAAVRAAAILKQEFGPRTQDVQEQQKKIDSARRLFDRDKDKLGEAEAQARGREIAEMMRRSDQMVMRLSEEYEQRKRELAGKLFEETRAAIEAVAAAGKYDLILQNAAYVRPGLDITGQVLKEMSRRGGK